MIDLVIFICFEMILESENIKQDGVKAETKLSCSLGFMACDGRIVCMCDWNCDTHNPSITSHEAKRTT